MMMVLGTRELQQTWRRKSLQMAMTFTHLCARMCHPRVSVCVACLMDDYMFRVWGKMEPLDPFYIPAPLSCIHYIPKQNACNVIALLVDSYVALAERSISLDSNLV